MNSKIYNKIKYNRFIISFFSFTLLITIITSIFFSYSVAGYDDNDEIIWRDPKTPDICVDNNGEPKIIWQADENYTSSMYITNLETTKKIFDAGYVVDPTINVGNDNDFQIIYLSSSKLFMMKLNNYHQVLMDSKNIKLNNITGTRYRASSNTYEINNNLTHICIWGNKEVWHIIIDEFGELLYKHNLTSYMKDIFIEVHGKISLDIDQQSNLNILWDNDVDQWDHKISKIRYLKQAMNGTIIVNTTFKTSKYPYIKARDIVSDSKNNVYIFWDSDIGTYYSLYMPSNTYVLKISPNGTMIYEKEIPTMNIQEVCIDVNDNFYIIGIYKGGEYKPIQCAFLKLNSNSSVITDILPFSDKYDNSLNLALDNNGGAHIVWIGREEVYISHGFMVHSTELDLYILYYTYIDENGKIIVDKMVIDSDEIHPRQNEPSILDWICFFSIIAIALIIIIVYLIRKQRIRENKGRNYYWEYYPEK